MKNTGRKGGEEELWRGWKKTWMMLEIRKICGEMGYMWDIGKDYGEIRGKLVIHEILGIWGKGKL